MDGINMNGLGILEQIEILRKNAELLATMDETGNTIMVQLPRDFYLILLRAAEAHFKEKS